MHIAAKQGNLQTVIYLVDKGAKIAITNDDKVRVQLLHTLSPGHSLKHKLDIEIKYFLLLQNLMRFQ